MVHVFGTPAKFLVMDGTGAASATLSSKQTLM